MSIFVLMKTLVDILEANHRLDNDQLAALLTTNDHQVVGYLYRRARAVAQEQYGTGIYLRGLIELSNVCRNDCLYCGIRRSNRHVERYTLTPEQVLDCCEQGYRLGFRTFVLQGGEWGDERAQWVADIVSDMRRRWPDCAITLSLGEHSREVYALWRECGADRYLLRHETHNAAHYARLHPAEMSLAQRLQCLDWLKELGYQVGTGIMVGSPGQTIAHLVEDVQFIGQFRPHMVGLGPFIAQHDTPLGDQPNGTVDMTTRLYSIIRLMLPTALIPSTTALATLSPQGRLQGILAGANVVMPNLSPADQRANYALYDGKASAGTEAAEGLRQLEAQLHTIGYHIDWSRGDHNSSAFAPTDRSLLSPL